MDDMQHLAVNPDGRVITDTLTAQVLIDGVKVNVDLDVILFRVNRVYRLQMAHGSMVTSPPAITVARELPSADRIAELPK